ncbi:sensor histidine kinase [Nonomuraea indica]|uniref:sensor histidine kinase n=1 Tax=Nonomuraea indica TaxID=1581193 RepID=UPI0015DEF8F5|nr:HAMP domain-containing sensor histidine kinase [Nonomuraea indica]
MIAVLVAAVVVAATSSIALATVPDSLRGTVRSSLESAVGQVAEEARAGQLPTDLRTPSHLQLLQVVSPRGEVLASTPGRPGEPHITAIQPERPGVPHVTEHVLHYARDPGHHHCMVMAMRVPTPEGPVTVYGAASLDKVNSALATLYALFFLGMPLTLAGVAGVAWTIVGSALRPVERIRSELAEITGKDLSRRVPVPGTGDEITHLALTTNATLDRLERSAETQRRFVADASHELRSPISGLRTQLEFAAAYPDETDWPVIGARALESVERLTGIVDELLLLARLDAGVVAERVVVDMCHLVREQVRRRAGGRVVVVAAPCRPAPVLGSAVQLDRLLTNLLDNATRHATARVEAAVREDGGDVVVTVTDDGAGIAPEDRERIFERFTRLEAARVLDKGGTGLGLPLSREIAVAHGGGLVLTDHRPGACFLVRLPLCPD